MSYFTHLDVVNKGYFEHFKNSMKFSCMSLQSSFFFFCHAIWPDIFQHSGSETISDLHNIINQHI